MDDRPSQTITTQTDLLSRAWRMTNDLALHSDDRGRPRLHRRSSRTFVLSGGGYEELSLIAFAQTTRREIRTYNEYRERGTPFPNCPEARRTRSGSGRTFRRPVVPTERQGYFHSRVNCRARWRIRRGPPSAEGSSPPRGRRAILGVLRLDGASDLSRSDSKGTTKMRKSGLANMESMRGRQNDVLLIQITSAHSLLTRVSRCPIFGVHIDG
jgi:hypothetical protein